MEPSAGPTKQPSASWRVLTGVLSLSFLVGGALAPVLVAEESDDATLVVVVFYFVTIPLWVAGALFALATIVPFGRFRRVMIGLGAAISAGVATLTYIVAITDFLSSNPDWTVLIAGAAAAGFFYLSYRLTR